MCQNSISNICYVETFLEASLKLMDLQLFVSVSLVYPWIFEEFVFLWANYCLNQAEKSTPKPTQTKSKASVEELLWISVFWGAHMTALTSSWSSHCSCCNLTFMRCHLSLYYHHDWSLSFISCNIQLKTHPVSHWFMQDLHFTSPHLRNC